MSESTDQAALFSLLNRLAGCDSSGRPINGITPRLPLLRWIMHPANEANGGGARTKNGVPIEAITNARSGVRAGVPDVIGFFNNQAPIAGRPAGGFVGIALELKSAAGRLRSGQRVWLAHLAANGWYTDCIVGDWGLAARLLITWAGGNPEEVGL